MPPKRPAPSPASGLAELMRAAKDLQENAKSWDPYMVRALQFSNAIDSAMSTYKTLFNTMKKQRSQLPITMFLTKVKKTNQATPEENTTPPPDSPEETTPPPDSPEETTPPPEEMALSPEVPEEEELPELL